MAEDELPEVETKDSWGSKHGQAYEVANGAEIENQGEKKFVGYMSSIEGWERRRRGDGANMRRPQAFYVGKKDV